MSIGTRALAAGRRAEALASACVHRTVETMITLAGPDGDDIREEIVMSVAQEEIETIARVAAECDVPLVVEDSGADEPIGVLPPAIEEALAEVEAELA